MNDIPILDCVADMQVVFGWNTGDPAGNDVDTYTNADMTAVSTTLPWTPSLNDPTDHSKTLETDQDIYIGAGWRLRQKLHEPEHSCGRGCFR